MFKGSTGTIAALGSRVVVDPGVVVGPAVVGSAVVVGLNEVGVVGSGFQGFHHVT